MSIFYYFPLLKTGFSLRSFRWPLLAFSQDHFKPRSLHLQVLLPALSSTSWKCKWSWSHCGAQKIQRSRKLSRGAQGDDLKGEISTFQIMRLFFFFFCRSAAVRGDRLYIKDGHSHRLEKSHFFEALIFQKPDVMADLCTVTNGCSPPAPSLWWDQNLQHELHFLQWGLKTATDTSNSSGQSLLSWDQLRRSLILS